MAEEVVVRSGKTLEISGVTWIVVDQMVPPVMPSIFTEARNVGSVVYLSLAQSVIDGNAPPEAHVCCRLRLDIQFAQMLHAQLGNLINDALKPVDKSQAN